MIVNGAAVLRSRTTSDAGQLGSLIDRTVKYIANNAAKNMSSLDSHTMVPTLTTLGRMSELPCEGTLSRAVADDTPPILSGGGACAGATPREKDDDDADGVRRTPSARRLALPDGVAGRAGRRRRARRDGGALPLGERAAAPPR